MTGLVDLPQDVLLRIMHELDVVDILNAERVGPPDLMFLP